MKQLKPIEVDEILIGNLLKNFKDEYFDFEDFGGLQCDLKFPLPVYRALKQNTQIYQFLLSYFKNLLIRLYKYNKQ